MLELRNFITDLRDRAGVPYPLAHFQPLTSGRNLVVQAQEASNLDPEYRLVLYVDKQYLLSTRASVSWTRSSGATTSLLGGNPQGQLRRSR